MVDYNQVEIQGDISRADVRVLIELCDNKRVVEFGVGGSTLIIARIAKSLYSFDTSEEWINRTNSRLQKIDDLTCQPTISLTAGVPEDIPDCDVLFIDGKGEERYKWLKFFPKCKIIICHDSLGDTGGSGPTLYHVMAEIFQRMDCVEYLDKAIFHYHDSNMAVIYRRDEPLKYKNWNIDERENRLDPYAQ
jgi:hypothetical protein